MKFLPDSTVSTRKWTFSSGRKHFSTKHSWKSNSKTIFYNKNTICLPAEKSTKKISFLQENIFLGQKNWISLPWKNYTKNNFRKFFVDPNFFFGNKNLDQFFFQNFFLNPNFFSGIFFLPKFFFGTKTFRPNFFFQNKKLKKKSSHFFGTQIFFRFF